MVANYIYLICDSEGSPRYVGKTFNLRKRFVSHKWRNDWAFAIIIIERVAEPDTWQEREKFWIAYYSQWYKLENTHQGGNGGVVGSKRPLETCIRISRVMKGKNIRRTDENKEKIRNTLKGRKASAATRAKLSVAQKRIWSSYTEEERERVLAKRRHPRGKIKGGHKRKDQEKASARHGHRWAEEDKKKMSLARKGVKKSPEHNRKN